MKTAIMFILVATCAISAAYGQPPGEFQFAPTIGINLCGYQAGAWQTDENTSSR